MNPAARVLAWVVRIYQKSAYGRPSPCRHVPSCSNYALEAVEAHGATRGGWLATKRLCRCHPWGSHGFDPVPAPRSSETKRKHPCSI
ncbi:MAG: membrane protein insertion efficiency factor YidD [Acidimicrobiaceae bacterium]|nr:membrane protein insertion efficiency factor YidD [Acidimicrobiaceae bacterium]MBT5581333.1 membrane protein insertion efficiency factor YidD [Acidimicrobiaceae bacterium]MBT5850993.1 membrane protein insertion efficiency factor YidD [Acidimicrobiaceae bacterium]